MEQEIADLVRDAQNGSKGALEKVVSYCQKPLYNLALRMLKQPQDAEDATQEIMIKVITHLADFRGQSAFLTWCYRIAHNTLLNISTRDRHKKTASFDTLSSRLQESLVNYERNPADAYEEAELVEEVRRGCVLGMLMCLNREDRLTLILGEVLNLSSQDGGYIMDTSAETFRKRLSRARKTLVSFVSRQCGLVNEANPCRCNKHVRNSIHVGSLDPKNLVYACPHDAQSRIEMARYQQSDLDKVCRTVALFRSQPQYPSRTEYRESIRELVKLKETIL